jgi:hypothetical protein
MFDLSASRLFYSVIAKAFVGILFFSIFVIRLKLGRNQSLEDRVFNLFLVMWAINFGFEPLRNISGHPIQFMSIRFIAVTIALPSLWFVIESLVGGIERAKKLLPVIVLPILLYQSFFFYHFFVQGEMIATPEQWWKGGRAIEFTTPHTLLVGPFFCIWRNPTFAYLAVALVRLVWGIRGVDISDIARQKIRFLILGIGPFELALLVGFYLQLTKKVGLKFQHIEVWALVFMAFMFWKAFGEQKVEEE